MTYTNQTPGQLIFEELHINREEVAIENLHDYIAVEYFLTVEDEPLVEASNLDKVKRYLESFHHLCQAEDWLSARKMFLVSSLHPDNPNNKYLLDLLSTWGYHEEAIQLCKKLLFRLEEDFDASLLRTLGDAFLSLGDRQKAREYYQNSLEIAEKLNRSDIKESIFNSLGIMHLQLGNLTQSEAFFHKLGNENRYAALLNLASVYLQMGDYKKAESNLRECLKIARRMNRLDLLASVSHSMGILYKRQGKTRQAIECINKALAFFEYIEAPSAQGECLGNLANLHLDMEEYGEAIKLQQRRLSLARNVRDIAGEGTALNNLAGIYIKQEKYEDAFQYLEKALANAQKISPHSPSLLEVGIISNLGTVLNLLDRDSEAIDWLEKGLTICQQRKYYYLEWQILAKLGDVYDSLNQIDLAFDCYRSSLKVSRSIGDSKGEQYILNVLSQDTYVQIYMNHLVDNFIKGNHSKDRIFIEMGKMSLTSGNYGLAIQMNELHRKYIGLIQH